MNGKSCFFIGHRDAPEKIFSSLIESIEVHISSYGVTEFLVGYYGNFDRMAARAVILSKSKHPEITLSLLLPYNPAERAIKTPEGFDNTYHPPGMEKVPRKFAIVRANKYVVEHIDYVIAYAWHPASNAANLIEYARRKNVAVTNLCHLHSEAESRI